MNWWLVLAGFCITTGLAGLLKAVYNWGYRNGSEDDMQ